MQYRPQRVRHCNLIDSMKLTCIRTTSPFWRTNTPATQRDKARQQSSSSTDGSKKIIGANYSHADILTFNNLYVRGQRVQSRRLTWSAVISHPQTHDLTHHHFPEIEAHHHHLEDLVQSHLQREGRTHHYCHRRMMPGVAPQEKSRVRSMKMC